MNKTTVKQRLVDFMIEQGNTGFTYKQVIERLLKFERGEDYQYNWRSSDRGWFSDAFFGGRGYFLNGGGTCGIYKVDDKYFAKHYTKDEMIAHAETLFQNKMEMISKYAQYDFGDPSARQFSVDLQTKRAKTAHKRNLTRINNLNLA